MDRNRLHDVVRDFNLTVKELKQLETKKAMLSDTIVAHVMETGDSDLVFNDGVKATFVKATPPSVKVDEKLFMEKAKDYMSAADYETVMVECLKETRGRKAYIR